MQLPAALTLLPVVALIIPGTAVGGRIFTPLEVDNHPCNPERLKNTVSYTCEADGTVHCNHGWKDRENWEELDPLIRCIEPICDPPCLNGECQAPNRCACEIGWEGESCGKCITMPGCIHGECKTKALECQCDDGYEGGLCDRPSCDSGCGNGFCSSPGNCTCYSGWEGGSCSNCKKLPGCLHGSCKDENSDPRPNSCFCDEGWEGHMCDRPKCTDCDADRGECRMIENQPTCICRPGYTGQNCKECQVYPGCPAGSTCQEPYDCDCTNVAEENKTVYCGIQLL